MPSKRTLIPGKLRDPEAPKVGRPSKEDVKARQVEEILENVAAGSSLEKACSAPGMPTPTEFRRWVRGDKDLATAWGQARRDQAHSLFDQMADLTAQLAEGEFGKDDNAKVTAFRVALDGLKHITSRLLPEAYAEQKPGQQAVVVNIVTPLALSGVPEQPIDTTFRVVGRLPEPEVDAE